MYRIVALKVSHTQWPVYQGSQQSKKVGNHCFRHIKVLIYSGWKSPLLLFCRGANTTFLRFWMLCFCTREWLWRQDSGAALHGDSSAWKKGFCPPSGMLQNDLEHFISAHPVGSEPYTRSFESGYQRGGITVRERYSLTLTEPRSFRFLYIITMRPLFLSRSIL